MPIYDGKACVSELLSKEKVLRAVSAGWDIAEPGCLPAKPEAMHTKASTHRQRKAQPKASSFSSRSITRQASSAGPSCSRIKEKEDVLPKLFVLQTRKLKIHGYKESVYTLCRQWKCGTAEHPTLDAVFTSTLDVSSSHMAVCRSCELQHGCVFPSLTTEPPPKEDEAGATSSSDSCSS